MTRIAKSEIGTFMEAFPNGVVWGNTNNGAGYDLVLLGQVEDTQIKVDEIQAKLDRPEYAVMRQSLRDIGMNSAVDLFSTFAGRARDLQQFQDMLAGWFDNAMARMSGMYKRRQLLISLLLALLLAILFNIDSIHLFRTLWQQPTLAAHLREALLVERLEVDFGEVDRREAGARDGVCDVRAQVREQDGRARNADERIDLFSRNVANVENARLLGFDQERNLVRHLGRHGARHQNFEHGVGEALGLHVDFHFDRRHVLLEENSRRIGLLERHVLQVDALDVEERLVILVGHDGVIP